MHGHNTAWRPVNQGLSAMTGLSAMVGSGTTPFVATWKTDNAGTSNNDQITLPFVNEGTFDCVVDWGDGNTSAITAWDDAAKTHTYAGGAGTYEVKITGTIGSFRFDNGGDKLKLLEVSQWGDLRLGTLNGYFYGCSNMTSVATDALTLGSTILLQNMFKNCTAFVGDDGMNSWDMSAVTDTRAMFEGCTLFNAAIGAWDVSSVVLMDYMFASAVAFNQALSTWVTSSATQMAYMFDNADAFNQSLADWDVGKVTTFERMFSNTAAFNGSVANWNVGGNHAGAITMDRMFYYAAAFNHASIDTWTMGQVTDISEMFSYGVFNQSLNSWDVSAVTTMFGMCQVNTAFNGNITSWSPSSCADFQYMFNGASAFNQDIGGWTLTAMTNISYMLYNCVSFDQDLSGWDVTGMTAALWFAWAVTLSTANYDALLIGWEGQAVQNNVNISFGSSKYTGGGAAATARADLIADHTWTIGDGGIA